MSVMYVLTQKENHGNLEVVKKYYVQAKSKGEFTFRKLSGEIAGKYPAIIGKFHAVAGKLSAVVEKFSAIVDMFPATIGKHPAVVGESPAVVGKFSAVIGKLPVAGKLSVEYTISDTVARYIKIYMIKKELI